MNQKENLYNMFKGLTSISNEIKRLVREAGDDDSMSKQKLISELGWKLTDLGQEIAYWRILLDKKHGQTLKKKGVL